MIRGRWLIGLITLALGLGLGLGIGVGCSPGEDPAVSELDAASGAPGTVHDPLSMPAEPTLDPAAFQSAQVCAACHPNHHDQWSTSAHAYAMVDPVFQALVRIRQTDLEAREDQFCTQCHSAIGTRGGECVSGFDFAALSPIVMEGVTCESCHRFTELARPYNSGHVLDPKAPIAGPLANPIHTDAHESRHEPLMTESVFCAGCHDVVETSGLDLERPYAEWLESPAGAAGRPCQSCHMPATKAPVANGGPEREAHSHRFLGVEIPLLPGFVPDAQTRAVLDADVEALLGTAAALSLDAAESVSAGAQMDVLVTITNRIDAHSLPTGTTFLRQLWLELTALDSEGRVLYRTGDLDEHDDLRNIWSELDPFGDPDLIVLTSRLVDADGDPVLFPWRASEHVTSSIPPLHSRTYTLFVPIPADVAGPVTVEARLLFRSVGPFLLRALGLAGLAEDLPVRVLAVATTSATVDED